MLVQTATDQEAPPLVFPFILQEHTFDVCRLLHLAVMTQHQVVQIVEVILQSGSQFGRHEQTAVERIAILRSDDSRHICGRSVSIRVFPGAIITLALGMLRRRISAETMFIVFREQIIFQSATVDVMIGLLGNIRFVRRLVERVSASAEFMDAMILQRQFRIITCLQIRTETNGLRADLSQFRIAVAVMIIRIADTALPEYINTRFLVVGHQRSIYRRIIIGTAPTDHRQRVRHLGRIAQRLFGNNIDGSRNRRRAEQGRTTAAHHFHPFDHIGRNLFQSIHAGQCAEDRAAVYQYLRIRSVQSVDTHLLETTVLELFSTRTPGWKFSPSANDTALDDSNTFESKTFTSDGAIRRVVSLRLAETTTPSRETASSSASKFTSKVFPFLRTTFFLTV